MWAGSFFYENSNNKSVKLCLFAVIELFLLSFDGIYFVITSFTAEEVIKRLTMKL
jgi:hypothetical protein